MQNYKSFIEPRIINNLKEIIIEAGQISLDFLKKGLIVESKKDQSPVSNADKEISRFIKTSLENISDITVICEEQPYQEIQKDEIFWLVDPIDGTRSYIKGEESFTINIALIINERPQLGLIYQPTTRKLYYTDENLNFCVERDGNLVKPEMYTNNEEFIAIVSSNYLTKDTKNYLIENKLENIISIPSSIKLCMIAEGSGDVFPKFGPTMEWDIAAGHALVNASGGKLCDLNGEEVKYAKPGFFNDHFVVFSKNWLANR